MTVDVDERLLAKLNLITSKGLRLGLLASSTFFNTLLAFMLPATYKEKSETQDKNALLGMRMTILNLNPNSNNSILDDMIG
jgi:hypothetical protein